MTRPALPLLLIALLLPPLAPGRAEEPDPRVQQALLKLGFRQKEAVARLTAILEDTRSLIDELHQRGETKKADLLEQAIRIVTDPSIKVKTVASGGQDSAGNELLGDLQSAMTTMARILEERPGSTDEVQDLGQRVVDTLEKVLQVLVGTDDVKSLEEREKSAQEVLESIRRYADRQRELRRETRQATPRTPAELAAEQASQELERLAKQVEKIDAEARRDLKEVEAARELASRLEALRDRQQRLHHETRVRARKTDELTPALNQILAGLEALATAARQAERASAERAATAEMPQNAGRLAERQERLAAEIAAREALEEALRALADNGEGEYQRALEEAAKRMEGAKGDEVAAAAKAPENSALRERAQRALEQALAAAASREALARDEMRTAKDAADPVLAAAPEKAAEELREAARKSSEAAENLEKGANASQAASEAAAAFRRAEAELKAAAAASADPGQRAESAAQREATARTAQELAERVAALAAEKRTRDAGLGGTLDHAKAAAERAAAEMREAAGAAQQGESSRAEESARAAAERAEQAMRELRQAMQERTDIADRQGRVGADLEGVAERSQEEAGKEKARAGAAAAQQAKQQLQEGDHEAAAQSQEQVLEQIEKLLEGAKAEVAAASERQKGAMDRAKSATAAAASKAAEVGKAVEEGARRATEADASRRMNEADAAIGEAEKALRRSLERLSDAMPKGAEQERRAAQEEIAKAKRTLDGLRESHPDPDADARAAMSRIAERQRALEEEIRRLEERRKKQGEKPGQERLADAESAMREARGHLERGEADDAEQAQERAEKSLEQAQQELSEEERRYRALREYELLFKLKEELKGFRRAAQAHFETLQGIDATARKEGRVSRVLARNQVEPLRGKVKALQRDMAEKAGAMRDEGAIVYTYLLDGAASDLGEVDAQLGLKELGVVPQELLGDVVRRLEMAIRGLERDLSERRQDQQQQQGQQGGQPQGGGQGSGKPRLVPPDAEIRMVKVLQDALNTETANFFGARPDLGQRAPTEAERARIERLYHQQGSLAELFDSLRQSFVGETEEMGFPGGEPGPGEGGDGHDKEQPR